MRSRFLWIVIGTAALLALALFYFLGGFGIFYRDSVDLKISGPEALEGGERMRWDVLATNRGSKTLEDVELLFEYPVGSKPLDAKAKALRDRKAIGKIAPGESVAAFFEAFVFGTQGEELSAKAELEYRPEDSSAILAKEKTFSTRIISSPIGISVDLPQEIRAGQETEIKISYVSNAQSELQDLFLKVEPPFGFSLKSARPAADEDGFWKIGTLEPGENGVVVIKGILAGSEGEEKSFRAAIGLKNQEGALDVYGGGVGTLTVKRPFLDIGIKLNGEKTRIAKAGEILEGEVSFKNNLPSPVANARIEVFFKGNGLDERQIRVEDGTFNASSRSILWNAASNEALRNLDPGQNYSRPGAFRIFRSGCDRGRRGGSKIGVRTSACHARFLFLAPFAEFRAPAAKSRTGDDFHRCLVSDQFHKRRGWSSGKSRFAVLCELERGFSPPE